MEATVDEIEPNDAQAKTEELDMIRQRAKEEFAKGVDTNRRYHAPSVTDSQSEIKSTWSEASTPSILNRSEVFHQNATAAVLSLLAPRRKGFDDLSSVASCRSNLDDPTALPPTLPPSTSAFHPPPRFRGDDMSVCSTATSPSHPIETADLGVDGRNGGLS